jgi:myo-inositol 2-dehydrogenase/D-chiro-inositol 1-dehydrogenase
MAKLGLIGCGRIGRLHARNLMHRVPGARLLIVADSNPQAAREVASELGVEHTSDYREVLARELDGVLVCTSTETHRQIVLEACEAGKHIFCEKPLARTPEEVEEMLRAVRRAGVKLQVGFNRRFDPNFSALRKELASGALGKPLVLKITSRDPDFPSFDYLRVSGGIWVDMTILDFDMARYLMGVMPYGLSFTSAYPYFQRSFYLWVWGGIWMVMYLMGEVEELYSTGSVLLEPRLRELGDLDTVITVLRFRSGALGVIDNCRRAVYGYDQRVEVLGEKGVVEVPNPLPVENIRRDGEGSHLSKLYYFFPERYEASFVEEMRAFVKCLDEGGEPPVSGEDGRMALLLALSAQRSFREGRPVKVG